MVSAISQAPNSSISSTFMNPWLTELVVSKGPTLSLVTSPIFVTDALPHIQQNVSQSLQPELVSSEGPLGAASISGRGYLLTMPDAFFSGGWILLPHVLELAGISQQLHRLVVTSLSHDLQRCAPRLVS